jgi:Flp pilus assembly protein TadD
MRHAHNWTLMTLSAAILAGCTGSPRGPASSPYSTIEPAARDPRKADDLNARAAAILDTDPAKAESLLRDALGCDLYHGPAHNNLGVLYLNQERYYEAAAEFEWARRLMPGHPDPRVNLALTLEAGGRLSDAIASYEAALEVRPGHLPALQGLARALVRTGNRDPRTRELLDELVMRGPNEQWREWAKRERVRME